ncbi:telomere repeat-binding factor 4-like [Populus alba x Populus x berolinensis]|uniref:Telomere repeat-binding factor 4-like n=1 Tax=Populus alba x Populus x berolinensis TaxID=444605 RepID=A0AAD6W008_9ROSI|nr:telomere repeat-binding factor 4-like [Populus alba x Populus x berolinensis]
MQQRQELPQNFRRQLSSRLRRLVAQEKLEKVQNCYKIKKVSSFGTKTPTPKKEVRPKSVHDTGDTVEGAANDAAYSVAEAENKSFVATEAVKESERVSKMAEDADSLLQLANEILEKCNSSLLLLSLLFHYLLIHALILDLAGLRGEIVIMG